MRAAAARVAPDLLYDPVFVRRTAGTTRPEPKCVRPRRFTKG
jgi:hypothetical protein